MQVLKFGGTSVSSAENMAQCAEIISRAVSRDRTIVVVSAISGFTDALISTGRLAAARDDSYKAILDTWQETHHGIIKALLPFEKHAESIETCDSVFDSIRGIAQGVFLLGELSQTSLDAIQGCGELVSSRILATKMASLGISTKWVDSRKIIRTSSETGKNVVDTALTYAGLLS